MFSSAANDSRKELLMIPLPRYLQSVVASVILSSLSVAGDTPGNNANSDRVAIAPPNEGRPVRQTGGLRNAPAL